MEKRFFQHENAVVETTAIGEGTRVWAFAHVLPGARIGRNCNICDHTFIENDVVIGDRVTIKCGVQIWDGVSLEDDVFVGPNATFTNDAFPRSGQQQDPARMPRTVVRRAASIGANATVLPGIIVGERAMVGAGAVVTHSVPRDAIVTGNPARIAGYVDVVREEIARAAIEAPSSRSTATRGVTLSTLRHVEDLRGELVVVEALNQVPFEVRRCFLVYNVPSKEIRGEHAHRTLHQFFICARGGCSIIADDGERRTEFRLESPSVGLYLPPLTWSVQYKHTSDALLVVLASAPYDPDDYMRDYSEFLQAIGRTR